jgi:malate synthase
LMEDTATAEISRAQVWQWVHHPGASLADGRVITSDLYRSMLLDELARIRNMYGNDSYNSGKFELAAQLFDKLVTDDYFTDFLTLAAYDYLD